MYNWQPSGRVGWTISICIHFRSNGLLPLAYSGILWSFKERQSWSMSMFGFFMISGLSLGVLITGLCYRVVMAGNQSILILKKKLVCVSFRVKRPTCKVCSIYTHTRPIFLTDFWFKDIFQKNFTLLFLQFTTLKWFYI